MRPLTALLLALSPNLALYAMQTGDLISAAGWLGAAVLAAWVRERRK